MRMNAHASRSRKQLLLAAAVGFMVCGCAPTDNAEPDSADTADAIYVGDIVTVNDVIAAADEAAIAEVEQQFKVARRFSLRKHLRNGLGGLRQKSAGLLSRLRRSGKQRG